MRQNVRRRLLSGRFFRRRYLAMWFCRRRMQRTNYSVIFPIEQAEHSLCQCDPTTGHSLEELKAAGNKKKTFLFEN